MYCVNRNSSWYINCRPLFGGCPLLGVSVIGGSTVYHTVCVFHSFLKVYYTSSYVGSGEARRYAFLYSSKINTYKICCESTLTPSVGYRRRLEVLVRA